MRELHPPEFRVNVEDRSSFLDLREHLGDSE